MQQQTDTCKLCGEVPSKGTGCNLKDSPSFNFSEKAAERMFERGQVIYKEQSTAGAVYAIQSGRVKLYRTDSHGNRQAISLLGPGDIFGFRTLLANELHNVTAEAIEATTLCVLPRQSLFEMFNISESLARDLMTKLAAELKVTEETMVSLLQHSVKQRTARLILSLIDKKDDNGGNGPLRVVKLQRTEMAQLIGTTPESLSRTLHSFGEKRLIDSTRTRITVLDRSGLEKVVKQND